MFCVTIVSMKSSNSSSHNSTPEYQIDLWRDRRGTDAREPEVWEDTDGFDHPEKSGKRHISRDRGVVGLHNDNLFDQDEDGAGESRNLATGTRIDNSTSTELTELALHGSTILDPLDETTEPLVLDDAERWLRENDPRHGHKGTSLADDEQSVA